MATTTTSSSNPTMMIPVTLKWSKKTFECLLDPNLSALDFKAMIQNLTGVPIHRQKLMAIKGKQGQFAWKGALSDDYDFGQLLQHQQDSSFLTVTLIGSAEILTVPTVKTEFLEDLTPLQLQAAEHAARQEAMQSTRGMIPAIQFEPHHRHVDEKKTEFYPYNHLVKGLPQAQIENLLLEQEQEQEEGGSTGTSSSSSSSTHSTTVLLGKVVMTMGLELRRAYINDMTVLFDGTLVSALDDGHIQLWKHGAQQHDVIHPPPQGGGGPQGGVDAVMACDDCWDDASARPPVAFASAGRGSIRLWNEEGQVLLALSASPIPHASTPAGLVRLPLRNDNGNSLLALAAHFRSTHYSDPHQFRLPPQNESERQRRAQAQAQEQALQNAIQRATQSVQIWYSSSGADAAAATNLTLSLKSLVLNNGTTFAISCLESIPIRRASSSSSSSSSSFTEIECSNTCLLMSGDVSGGLRVWRVDLVEQNNDSQLVVQEQAYVRLSCPSSSGNNCSIVCMKALHSGMLAVSTAAHNGGLPPVNDVARDLTVARARAVHIISGIEKNGDDSSFCVAATINGHQDVVQCLCELPNGDLLTAGGKMDATIKLWSHKQIHNRRSESSDEPGSRSNSGETRGEYALLVDPAKTLPSSEAGYVFALQVLLDRKPGSTHFAVAVARYNVVKILL